MHTEMVEEIFLLYDIHLYIELWDNFHANFPNSTIDCHRTFALNLFTN